MKEYHCMCGQLFDDIIDQNEHILTHFDKKQCIGCENHLIFVAGKWYQPHTDLNCNPIKLDPKHDHISIDSTLLNEHGGEDVGDIPNIELVELPALKDECFDVELDRNGYIEDVDTSLMGQISANPFKCELCSKTFKLKSSLRRHRKICTRNNENRPENIEFQSLQQILGNQFIQSDGESSMMEEPTKPFECEMCPKAFKLKSSLRRHRKICENRPDFQTDTSELAEIDVNQAIPQSQRNQFDAPTSSNVQSSGYCDNQDWTVEEPTKPFKCEFCPKTFKLKSSLRRHRKICENRPDEQTDDSKFDQENLEQYQSEKNSIEKSAELKHEQMLASDLDEDDSAKNNSVYYFYVVASPEPCDESSQSAPALASNDQLNAETSKKYACTICSARFVYKHCVKRHYHALHGDDQVDKGQRLYDIDPVAAVTRDSDGNVQCNYCAAKFKRLKYLGKHKRLYHRDRLTHGAIKCSKCPATFQTEKSIRAHMLRKHNPIKKSHKMQFVCYVCHKACQFPKELVMHLRTHPNIEYKCCFDGCGSQHETYNKLYLHLLRHLQIKCKQCGKCYTQIKLGNHRCTTDSTTKNFICDHCGKAFSSIRLLSIHMNGHTGKRPYSCDVCNKSYTQPGGLWRHRYIHSGKSTYTCDVENCNRAFNQDTDLYRHQFKVHGIFRKKFPCTLCDQVFPENAMLRKHLDNHETV